MGRTQVDVGTSFSSRTWPVRTYARAGLGRRLVPLCSTRMASDARNSAVPASTARRRPARGAVGRSNPASARVLHVLRCTYTCAPEIKLCRDGRTQLGEEAHAGKTRHTTHPRPRSCEKHPPQTDIPVTTTTTTTAIPTGRPFHTIPRYARDHRSKSSDARQRYPPSYQMAKSEQSLSLSPPAAQHCPAAGTAPRYKSAAA